MFQRKVNSKELDKVKINELVVLSKKVLNVLYGLLIIVALYAIIIITKELNIIPFLKTTLKIVSPLFIGLIIAWLFDPFVKMLNRKGIKRGWGAVITYALFLGAVGIVLIALIPMLSNEINDFVRTLPGIFDSIEGWIDNLFNNLNKIENFDAMSMKNDIFTKIEEFGVGLTESLPGMAVTLIQSLFSGMGTFLVGFIIGFYLLVSFNNIYDTIIPLLPKRIQKDTIRLADAVNHSLRSFVKGALLDSALVFFVTSIALWLVGLKAPVLFGLFCGLTNIIPYAGPYIGGAPAVIVGFTQSPTVGILTLAVIVVIQFIEGNFFQPLVMSKTTKLHPVTIMLGLLVFGYFWGIIGMLVATPIIAVTKAIFCYFDEKYGILDMNW